MSLIERSIDATGTMSLKFNPRFIGKEELSKSVSALSRHLRLRRPRPLERRTLERARAARKKFLPEPLSLKTVLDILGAHFSGYDARTETDQPPTLNREDVREKLQISWATFYRMRKTGRLPKPVDNRRGHPRWATQEIERLAASLKDTVKNRHGS